MGSDTTTQRFQRRTVLVKRTLQLKYTAIIFAAVLVTALIVGVDIYYTMRRIILEENPVMLGMVAQVARLSAVKMIIFLGIMFLVSLFVSHRFAGPIFRFERSAQQIATGDLTHRVSLRTGDDLVELQDEMNAMVTSLQRLVQKDRTLIDHLCTRIDDLSRRLPEAPDGKLDRLREELSGLKAEIRHLTQGFKA